MKRFFLFTAVLSGLAVLVGCGSNTEVATITITPASQSLAAGQTAQFTATGTIPHGKHPATTQDVTNLVTWKSSSADIATISASGMATAVSAGTATITASMAGANPATATVTVTGTTTSKGSDDVVALSIYPDAQAVASPNQTSQFIAIGITASGATLNLNAQVSWTSSSAQIASITPSGLATGAGQGTAMFTAVYTNPDKTVATGKATFTVTGGASEPITALSIIPGSQSLAVSQNGQFAAIGTAGSTGLTQDVTNSAQLKWTSSVPTIASVSASGQATGVSAGTTTIAAVWTNPDGTVVTSSVPVTVTATAAPEPLLSITVLPTDTTTNNLLGTGQFLAYGTFSTAPTLMDVTNGFTRKDPVTQKDVFTPVTWISSAQSMFPINSYGATGSTGGLVTAAGSGTTDIYAVAANPDGTLVYSSPVTFQCPYVAYVPADPTATPPTQEVLGSCNDHTVASGLLVTLTVFNAGLNTTNWEITADSATGTKNVIHCGPGWALNGGTGGQVCLATYPVGTTVTLTAPAGAGKFGGWSWNCTPTTPISEGGPNSCQVVLGVSASSNESVGAVFN